MKKTRLHSFFLALSVLALAGCAVYPVVQVAGGAMTGYDAMVIADDYLPRNGVKGGERGCSSDQMIQRRLRERLSMHRLPVSAHVIDGNAYLVGQFPSRAQANQAVNVAKTVQGLRTITCKFYQETTAREAGTDSRLRTEVTQQLAKTKRLKNVDLRVEVIHSNAIIVGKAENFDQKTAAVAIASEVGGISEVIDYISVTPQPTQDTKSNDIAMK